MPNHNQIKKQRNNSVYVPRVSYQVAKESYFCHDNQVHAVVSHCCPGRSWEGDEIVWQSG